eukprot:4673946-Prymnesium_polylepis.1
MILALLDATCGRLIFLLLQTTRELLVVSVQLIRVGLVVVTITQDFHDDGTVWHPLLFARRRRGRACVRCAPRPGAP